MFVLLYLLDISQRFILQEKQITRTLSSVFLTTHTLHQMSRKGHKLEDSLYCMCKFQSKTYSDFCLKKKKKPSILYMTWLQEESQPQTLRKGLQK